MRLALKRVFVCALIADVLLVVALTTAEFVVPGYLVNIRLIAFSHYLSDPADFELPPGQLVARGFAVDSPELIQKWRDTLSQDSKYQELFAQLKNESSTVEKIKHIARSFSRNGCLVAYGHAVDLQVKLATISEGLGVCSDHTEVFQALANLENIFSIDTVLGVHNICDVYCPEEQRWIWVDPQYCLLAKGPSGEYLSAMELRDAYLQREKIYWEYFGVLDEQVPSREWIDNEYYHQPSMVTGSYAVAWGNNVLYQDQFRQSLLFMPKSLRQIPQFLFGIKPKFYILDDGSGLATWCSLGQILIFATGGVLIIGTIAFPLLLIVTMALRLRHAFAASSSFASCNVESAVQVSAAQD